MAKRKLNPLDLTLRRARGYQWARRLFLGFWVAATFVLPLWHLHALDVEGAGLARDSRWAAMASWLPSSPPPFVGAPTSVWLWVVDLVDPAEALAVALVRGVSASWVWTVLPGVVLVLLLGRFFCGWACPYLPLLAASNAARWLLGRVGFEPRDLEVPRVTSRVLLVGVLLGTAVTGAQLLPLIYPPAVIGREIFRAVFYGSLGLGALLVVAAFLFDTFVSRAGFCRSLCPGGATFSLLGALSPLTVTNQRAKCTSCTACDVVCNLGQSPMTARVDSGCERCGRCVSACPTGALSWGVGRSLALVHLGLDRKVMAAATATATWEAPGPSLDGSAPPSPSSGTISVQRRAVIGAVAAAAAAALVVVPRGSRASAKRIRPPGALPHGAFEQACIGCFRCAEVCPTTCIRFPSALSPDLATPFIDTAERACVLCMKCTQVCPTGALEPLDAGAGVVAEKVRMGTPVLTRSRCLPWNGEGICRVCSLVCPYPEKAVTLVGPKKAPLFHPEACVGCGLCEEACPETAQAIRIVPFEKMP